MKRSLLQGRTLAVLAVIISLLAVFIYVGLRSGPLAPITITTATVESRSISPALFGIGTVEARYTYKIGPTFAGRILQLEAQVGDQVTAGQILGEMDPVDLDDRVRSQGSVFKRAQAALLEAEARQAYAQSQVRRYEQLFAVRSTSEELLITKRQELQIADAVLSAVQQDLARAKSDQQALITQRNNLRLIAPVDGVVIARDADPGTTLVAGQAAIEIIDPTTLWLNVRFDQISAAGLAKELPARIGLRSRNGKTVTGTVLRIEPKADAITEEMLTKVVFDTIPMPLPPLGELAEVTVDLPALPTMPVIPNAAIRRDGNTIGVWKIIAGKLHFAAIKLGAADLDGYVQVVEGLNSGDEIVLYSEKALSAHSRIHIAERIVAAAP